MISSRVQRLTRRPSAVFADGVMRGLVRYVPRGWSFVMAMANGRASTHH